MHISRENYIRQALDEALRTKSKKSSSTVAAHAATEWDNLHAEWLDSLPAHPRMAEWIRRDWLSPDERALRVDGLGRWLDYRPERDGTPEELLARIEADLADMDRAAQAKRDAEATEAAEATRQEQGGKSIADLESEIIAAEQQRQADETRRAQAKQLLRDFAARDASTITQREAVTALQALIREVLRG